MRLARVRFSAARSRYVEAGDVAGPGRVATAGCWSSVLVAPLADEAGTPVTVTIAGCWASVLVGSVM
jgi:hypothetical protein